MTFRDNEIAVIAGPNLLAREVPLRLTWRIADLVAADGFGVVLEYTAGVVAPPGAADRRMLREAFLGGAIAVTTQAVTERFAGVLRDAAARSVPAMGAAEAMSDAGRATIAAAMDKAARTLAFGVGLDFVKPVELRLTSPGMEKAHAEEARRRLAEQRAARAAEHLANTAQQMSKLRTLREQNPGIPIADVVARASAGDQGAMFSQLVSASAADSRAAATLWAVAGPFLLRIDARVSPPRVEQLSLPQTLGPLRSVQGVVVDGRTMLAVGVQAGVLLVDPASPANPVELRDEFANATMGFSRVVAWAGHVVAVHGEAGVVAWRPDSPQRPAWAIRVGDFAAYIGLSGGDPGLLDAAPPAPPAPPAAPPPPPRPAGPPPLPGARPAVPVGESIAMSMRMSMAQGASMSVSQQTTSPRNLAVVDEARLVVTCAKRVVAIGPGGVLGEIPELPDGDCAAVLNAGDRLLLVHDRGDLTIFDTLTNAATRRPAVAGRVTAAATMPFFEDVRLLAASDAGPVFSVGLDDPLIAQYVSPHRGSKILAATHDLVVAASVDRSRLVVWNAADPAVPRGEIMIAQQTRHRAADVEFV